MARFCRAILAGLVLAAACLYAPRTAAAQSSRARLRGPERAPVMLDDDGPINEPDCAAIARSLMPMRRCRHRAVGLVDPSALSNSVVESDVVLSSLLSAVPVTILWPGSRGPPAAEALAHFRDFRLRSFPSPAFAAFPAPPILAVPSPDPRAPQGAIPQEEAKKT